VPLFERTSPGKVVSDIPYGQGTGRRRMSGFMQFLGNLGRNLAGQAFGRIGQHISSGGPPQVEQFGWPTWERDGASSGGLGMMPPSMRPRQYGGGYGYRPPTGGGMLPGQRGISPYARPMSPQMFGRMYGQASTGGAGGFSPWTTAQARGMQRYDLGVGGQVRPPMPMPRRPYPIMPARQALGTGQAGWY